MRSLVLTPSPVICASIRQKTKDEAISDILNSQAHGAKCINLHLSFLDKEYQNYEPIKEILSYTKVPTMILNYSVKLDGSFIEWSEDERIHLLKEGMRAGGDILDMQGYSFDTEAKGFYTKNNDTGYSFFDAKPKEITINSKAIDKQMEVIEEMHYMGKEVLLSTHTGVPMTCEQLVDLALYLEKRKPDILKFVTFANTEEDTFEAYKTMVTLKKEIQTPVSFHCSGAFGKITRVITPILGSKLMFCNDMVHPGVDYTQPDLQSSVNAMEFISKIK